jgi:S1-C subfamily serine protease
VALLVALVTLLSAGAAYAAVSLLTGSGGQSSAQAGTAPAWLGIEMASTGFGGAGFPTVGGFPGGFPTGSGVLITEVVPGSPAAAAGLGPGDVLTQIGSQLVATPADVQSAIAGLQAGDRVEIHYEQGATLYTTQATLAARPAGYP